MPVEILEMDIPAVAKLLWADIHSFTDAMRTFSKATSALQTSTNAVNEQRNTQLQCLRKRELIEVSTDGRRRKCRASVDNLSMRRQSGEAESPKCLHSKQDREQPRKQVSRAKPNSRDEVHIYSTELGMDMAEGDRFVDYYESNGWKQGRGKAIKDGKSPPAIGNAMQNNGLQSLAGLTRATSQLTEQSTSLLMGDIIGVTPTDAWNLGTNIRSAIKVDEQHEQAIRMWIVTEYEVVQRGRCKQNPGD